MKVGKFITPLTSIGIIFLIFPFLVKNPYWLNLISLLEIYILVGLGLNMLLGNTGQASLGHGAVYGIGAYTSAILMVDYGFPFWMGIISSVIIAGIVGLLLSLISFRLHGFYLAMVTMAFAIIIERALVNFGWLTHGAEGIVNIPKASFGTWTLSPTYYNLFIAFVLFLGIWIVRNLANSDFGRVCWAIHRNEITASCLGVNVYKAKIHVFIISCVFAGIGGVLYAHLNEYISPDTFSLELSFFFALVVIVGGMGSFWGPFLGSFALLILPETLNVFQQFKLLIYGFLLLFCIILLPKGFVGLVDKLRAKKNIKMQQGSEKVRDKDFLETQILKVNRGKEILKICDIYKVFGGLTALNGLTLSVQEGSIHSLIGPNGSGKTTLLNVVSSLYKPDNGRIFFKERDVTGLSPHRIAALGIGRTFQNVSIYPDLTVIENILLGFHTSQKAGLFSKSFNLPRSRREEERMKDQASDLAALIGLREHLFKPAGTLEHNQKRFLEIARALGGKPSLLLLDEPGAGLGADELPFLKRLISRLRDMGISLLIIEHHIDFVVDVSDVISVLNYGEKIAEGSPNQIVKNQDVIEAYLGIMEDSVAET